MEDSSRKSAYSTPDTALAAWLYSLGFELLDTDTSEFPTIFYFEDSDKELARLARDFQIGRAEGNITAFFRAYKFLLGKIKVARHG